MRWRPLTGSGLEHVRIYHWNSGVKIFGTLIGETDETPFGLSYEINLALDWSFEALLVQTDTGTMEHLRRDPDGDWHGWRDPLPELAACTDIDLSGSPLTNTLPIRRVTDWQVGIPRHFSMAYVDLPRLSFRPHRQIYTWLGENRYRYQNADESFSADLTVDDAGFVVDYPPLFKRA